MGIRRGKRFGLGLLLLTGCADARLAPSANPLAPTTVESVDALWGTGGAYPPLEEVPLESRVATVYSSQQSVRWDGNVASGYGHMDYFGNRGEHQFEMHILHGYATVATARSQPRVVQDYLPWRRIMGSPFEFSAAEDCGQTVNLYVTHRAKTIVIYNSTITTIGLDEDQAQESARQPDCSPPPPGGCGPGGGENLTSLLPADPNRELSPENFAYDPYDPGAQQTVSCGGGGTGGGTGDGSGGDGSDSGGSFAETCGSLGGKLYYDYGCLEAFDPETQEWEQVWCGTIAVCET